MLDDGEFTIPAEVLELVSDGEVTAFVTRANRELQSAGGHMILLDAKIENSYRFMFGAQ